jgi:glyoxylase-like metal-dependent hydrolase (beta-lactamase superfamily II)
VVDNAPATLRTTLAPTSGFYHFPLGEFQIIPLHDGVVSRERPPGFVRNADDADVGEAYAVAGMPRANVTITFTPLLIRTPRGLILIDTGLGPGGAPGTGQIMGHLQQAGVRAEDIGTIIISHFHGDHVSGLIGKDGTPLFPDATLLVPAPEWRFWMDDATMSRAPEAQKANFALARKVFGPRGERVQQFEWGTEVLPGFTAVDAGGHTPGMAAIEIVSGDAGMMFVADVTNNPLIFARHPEWQARFDMDGDLAVTTRRRLLDRASADRLRLAFFHAPFPATGFVVKNGNGYEYLPALWTSATQAP